MKRGGFRDFERTTRRNEHPHICPACGTKWTHYEPGECWRERRKPCPNVECITAVEGQTELSL